MAKPRILVIGAYSLPNAARDAFNVEATDIAGTLRRRQLRTCAEQLAGFGPTKVALDVDAGQAAALNRHYRAFRDGQAPPPENDGRQLGFWTARVVGLDQVHAVDVPARDVDADPFAFAFEHGQEAAAQPLLSFYQRQTVQLNTLLHTGSVLDLLRFINDEARLRQERTASLRLAQVGEDIEYPGVEWLAAEGEHALFNFANVLRLTESAAERILVLCGYGGLGPLLGLIQDSRAYVVEKAAAYLA